MWYSQAAEAALADANTQIDSLVASSRDGALAFEERMSDMQRELQDSRAAREAAERRAVESQELASALQQQIQSMKDALRSITQEKEVRSIAALECHNISCPMNIL